MGYYTSHTLTVNDGNEYDHAAAIELIADYSGLFEGEAVKWYEHESDMRSYSLKNKGVLFKLEGEGEESGDLWVEYYKEGKMQRSKAKITFDEFDESKLC